MASTHRLELNRNNDEDMKDSIGDCDDHDEATTFDNGDFDDGNNNDRKMVVISLYSCDRTLRI